MILINLSPKSSNDWSELQKDITQRANYQVVNVPYLENTEEPNKAIIELFHKIKEIANQENFHVLIDNDAGKNQKIILFLERIGVYWL
jgi:hypothetical protein